MDTSRVLNPIITVIGVLIYALAHIAGGPKIAAIGYTLDHAATAYCVADATPVTDSTVAVPTWWVERGEPTPRAVVLNVAGEDVKSVSPVPLPDECPGQWIPFDSFAPYPGKVSYGLGSGFMITAGGSPSVNGYVPSGPVIRTTDVGAGE